MANSRQRKALRVGTAAWGLTRDVRDQFPAGDSQLARYAAVLDAVEINSSFYRSHSFETYARWAASTPRAFRFAVKVPRAITHDLRLRRARRPLEVFLAQVAGLRTRLGPLLIQLPPSFAFESRPVRGFFRLLRDVHEGAVACEPRHESWLTARAGSLLEEFRIARVAADPAPVAGAREPGGWSGLRYYRLHGSPRRYWSVYTPAQMAEWVARMRATGNGAATWCIFDNTAGGGAIRNALDLRRS